MLPIIAKYALGEKATTFKPAPWLTKVVVIIVVLIAFNLFFGKKIKAAWNYMFNPGTDDTAGREIKKENLTYGKTMYKSLAGKLQAAMDVWGTGSTDEDAIYDVFRKMNTVDDVLAIINGFGKRPYLSFFGFSEGDYGLSKWLTRELSSSEMATINNILSKKGINFNF